MSVLANLFAATRHPHPFRGLTRHFFVSGLVLATAIAYTWLWSVLSQRLTGEDLYAIGSKPAELANALRGGDIVVVLSLAGFLWLFMTGFTARGAMIRQRDCRIAELEAKLNRRES